MAHEQRREKMTKKPKKDTSPPKAPAAGDNPRPTPGVTAVIPRGKDKDKDKPHR